MFSFYNLEKQKTQEHEGCLHHYVQLFYLWFHQDITSILLHTMHVIKVQLVNFKDKKNKKTREEKNSWCFEPQRETPFLLYTVSCIERGIDSDVMATACVLTSYLSSEDYEFYCMVVRVKVLILGHCWDHLQSSLQSTHLCLYVVLMMRNVHACWTFLTINSN